MTAPSPRFARLLLALAATSLAALVVEGASSLIRGRGVLGGGRPDALADWVVALRRDADRFAAAANLEGIYQAHPDPFVRYTCRAAAEFEIRGISVSTDELGQRKRVAPPAPANAVRIAILGDSVAFGYGLDDRQTLAAALERQLTAATKPGGRPVACLTVAAPGWNLRQACRFLLDHRDTLRPDFVLFISNNNDLHDADSVAESGHRFTAPDPAQRDPLVLANANASTFLALGLEAQRRKLNAEARRQDVSGPEIMTSALTTESLARFDAAAEEVAALQSVLARDGSRLAVVRYVAGDYATLLEAALARRDCAVAIVPFLARVEKSLTLGDDPHPNATTIEGLATVVARHVGPAVLGTDFDATRLDAIPDAVALALDSTAPATHHAAREAETKARLATGLRAAFDTATAEGARQVYGGVNPDGTLGRRALLALARIGGKVRVHLQPILARPDLLPNRVSVVLDGAVVGALDVASDPLDRIAVFTAPPAANPNAIEVSLVADRVGITRLAGASQVASVRIVRIEVLSD